MEMPRRTRNAIIWRQVLIKAVEGVMIPKRVVIVAKKRQGPMKRRRIVEGNWNFEREEVPSWASAVGSLAETLNLNQPQNGIKANSHVAFLKRYIEAPMGYLYTV